jgi:hypothetical protein
MQILANDIDALRKDYVKITKCLYQLYNNGIDTPNYPIETAILYWGKHNLDPWQTLVDFDVILNENASIESFVLFNVVNIAQHGNIQSYEYPDVFAVDDTTIKSALSSKLFVACCMVLFKAGSSFYNNTVVKYAFNNTEVKYAFSILHKMNCIKPLFFAKLFTDDISYFMSCISYANMIALQTFIKKSFIEISKIDKKMSRKLVSLFEEECIKISNSNMLMR